MFPFAETLAKAGSMLIDLEEEEEATDRQKPLEHKRTDEFAAHTFDYRIIIELKLDAFFFLSLFMFVFICVCACVFGGGIHSKYASAESTHPHEQ